MSAQLYVEIGDFTVAEIFTKDDKSKLSAAMKTAARDALKKTKLTVDKKTATTRNFSLSGAVAIKKNGAGAEAKASIQLNRMPGDKLFGMASGSAATNDLGMIEDLAVAVVSSVVTKQIPTALKKAAAEK